MSSWSSSLSGRLMGSLVCLTSVLAVSGCVTGSGGGGGVIYTTGKPAGTPCDANLVAEGCLNEAGVAKRMVCSSGAWQVQQVCQSGEGCVEVATANSAKKVTECKAIAGTTPDVQTGGDTATAQDGTGGSDTTSVQDTTTVNDTTGPGPDTTVGDGSGGPNAQILACAQQKCADSWSGCKKQSDCAAALTCLETCSGDAACGACYSSVAPGGAQLLNALVVCFSQQGCIPGAPVCGNGKCDPGESNATCASDCPATTPVCGDGKCQAPENSTSCKADCGGTTPVCGNGTCEPGESAASCQADCSTGPVCGNGVCDLGENSSNCQKDCGGGPVCGNGLCEAGESQASCPVDCKGTVTPDCKSATDQSYLKSIGYTTLFSQAGQQCVLTGGCLSKPPAEQGKCVGDCLAKQGNLSPSCSLCIGEFAACGIQKCLNQCMSNPTGPECEACVMSTCQGILLACGAPPPTSGPVCGNGKCESGETKTTCAADCGPKCGNGLCEAGETSANCKADCGSSGPVCGNGLCETGETATSCSVDCKTTPVCGNAKCEAGETASNCAKDCGGPAQCGNFKCDAGESEASCPFDCLPENICVFQACPTEVPACLGDSACAQLYQCIADCAGNQTCAQGCASKAGSAAVNKYVAMGECINASGCDGGSNPVCGNGKCESGESSTNCKADCGSGTGHPCDSACGGQAPSGCYCDAACKGAGDCCTASGQASGTSCAGSTCGDCK